MYPDEFWRKYDSGEFHQRGAAEQTHPELQNGPRGRGPF
jgi:hypothetical protein